jgi:ubiquinone/menaquinone biosynthesis C-methylase UbiE
MGSAKSAKELAFLKDLFIAPDWGERFAELVDEHVPLPEKGRALYLAIGTGSHAMALQERAGQELKFLCVDESEECLELARAKAATAKSRADFQRGNPEALELGDDQFDLSIGDASLVSVERVPAMLGEMVRVTAPGGTVALSLPTSSSFGEFFSIYWEALHNSGFFDHEADVENLITELPTVSDVEGMAANEGLEEIQSLTRIEEFDYESGEDFLNSPLIADFLMGGWLQSLPEESKQRVSDEVARLINEERHNAEFSLTVKATLITGRKARLPLVG